VKSLNLVDEVHWNVANFLYKNFDVVLLPGFGTRKVAKLIKKALNVWVKSDGLEKKPVLKDTLKMTDIYRSRSIRESGSELGLRINGR
jgi:hypothetical protein